MENIRKAGRKPDAIVAAKLGITVEEMRAKRKEEKLIKIHKVKADAIVEDQKALERIDQIHASCEDTIKEQQKMIIALRNVQKKSQVVDKICNEFIEAVRAEGLDFEIVLEILQKIYNT